MLTSPGSLVPGQTLVILFPTLTHTVRGGETIYSIAEDFGTDMLTLKKVGNNYQIVAHQQIER